MSVLSSILRSGEGKKIKALQAIVPDINALEPEVRALSDDALRARTADFRSRLAAGEDLDDLLVESFAVVREAAWRVIGQRHYDVQLMGGMALHLGWVAEMRTGEGKTLVSTLPAYLNGLSGRGVHLCTVNDYLATRDAEWMGQIHKWLGLSVGLVVPGVSDRSEKAAAYGCDITYATNNELGFDYLRDNMAMSLEQKAQRGHVFCLVDEVDSILIDEARTPLIISGRLADAVQLYTRFAGIVRGLQREVHYDFDEEKRIVAPTEAGVHALESALGIDNLYDQVAANLVHQFHAALKAKELYLRDKDYIVADGEVRIVDEFTGRVLDGRRWSDGIHQAVEAKEGVVIKEENQTLATITLQNYFRLYEKLAGMTGTAETEAAELAGIYSLQVVSIPTNRPLVRDDCSDLIYKTEAGKFTAVVDDIVERRDSGQPVLVGTVSVENSEKLSRELEKRGVGHEVLNAKQHFREADVVAQAGRPGAVTVATNMAGRGVDIILGGNAESLAERAVRADGEDLDSKKGRKLLEGQMEHFSTQCEADGERVRKAGGLYVLGTERHESRRIDNQLRGRSGRQGDPGESRFYLSLDDDLMRLFASGAMRGVMDRALPEDVPIESKMVSKAIERAQTTVEQKNAEVRKNVLKYDEVMNEQRNVIYRNRDRILGGADLRGDVLEHLGAVVDDAVDTFCASDHPEEWDLDGLRSEIDGYWPTSLTTVDLADAADPQVLYDLLAADGLEVYEEREADLGAETMREVERQVMLRIVDQRWREHLYEMDQLREGIHLRAIGQRDPATEWQREGFELFGQLTGLLGRDFLRYVMRIQVTTADDPEQVTGVTESGPENPVIGAAAVAAAAGAPARVEESTPAAKVQKVNTEWEATPRNAPCPCDSGRKFKHCHGS
ncbi:MAG: preprotein translocase subunit SecA [Acidimicrobiia bacterium]|nr:preprotein translocase subunit SecA [Actinomycetota bacterium]MBL6923791.1 preprotein translocase subunit SecA [Acidimicrobiia bacterium]MBL6925730.1 preprotein translocase subunit SecA [Acidimicrobiia bacterium]